LSKAPHGIEYNEINLKIFLKAVEGKSPRIPQYKSSGSAGADIFACLEEPLNVKPGCTVLIPTGFCMAIPLGYEAQIRPRSGLAIDKNIGLLNSPGTIDSDYRGEVKIILTNFGNETFTIKDGDRIAQMVIAPVIKADFQIVDKLALTERGEGGFGHTGL